MGTLSHTLGCANDLLTWVWLLWFGAGIVVGGMVLAHDEWRQHRTRPKPEQVQALADRLFAQHGQDAFRMNGDATLHSSLGKVVLYH